MTLDNIAVWHHQRDCALRGVSLDATELAIFSDISLAPKVEATRSDHEIKQLALLYVDCLHLKYSSFGFPSSTGQETIFYSMKNFLTTKQHPGEGCILVRMGAASPRPPPNYLSRRCYAAIWTFCVLSGAPFVSNPSCARAVLLRHLRRFNAAR